MNLKEKYNRFAELCGDWDFRNIDMTQPHLSSISINNKTVYLYCEIFSDQLDDYVSCYAGACKDQSLVKMFYDLDLNDVNSVKSDQIKTKLNKKIMSRKQKTNSLQINNKNTYTLVSL